MNTANHLALLETPLRPFLVATACLATAFAHAGEAISTDRPDFVESSEVVGLGRVQVEAGLATERNAASGIRTHTLTTPVLLRFGVGETIELRAETAGRTIARTSDVWGTSHDAGWADASFGVKWRTQEGSAEEGKPGVAWLAHLDVDSGSARLRGRGVRPSLRMVTEWDLPLEMSVGVMPGIVLDRRADGHRFTSGILAATVGKAWTSSWRTYVEVAGQQLARTRNGGTVVTLDTGAAYLVNDGFQVDLSLQRGLTRQAPDFTWSIGGSARF